MIDPDFVLKLFEKILDYQKKIIKIYYSAIGPYVHYTSSGDDFATQESMLWKYLFRIRGKICIH
jgi:uroporphyrinogen decarboxylase